MLNPILVMNQLNYSFQSLDVPTVNVLNSIEGNGAGSSVLAQMMDSALSAAYNLASVALGNFATGGSIGLASATVDFASLVLVAQTTAAQTITVPAPSVPKRLRTLIVANTGAVSFTVAAQVVAAGAAVQLLWNGAAWVFVA